MHINRQRQGGNLKWHINYCPNSALKISKSTIRADLMFDICFIYSRSFTD